MQNKLEVLVPEGTYHLYNRANGSEMLFLTDENYRFFMEKWRLYIQPIAEVYCYCLMSNHFHFLLRIRSEKEILSFFGEEKCKRLGCESLVSKQFSNLFSSYTQSFNKVYHRMGSLFMKNFKRKRVMDGLYFKNLVYYIHYNPIVARLCEKLEDYKYSSYGLILNDGPSWILKEELISHFGDRNNFIHFHKNFSDDQNGIFVPELE